MNISPKQTNNKTVNQQAQLIRRVKNHSSLVRTLKFICPLFAILAFGFYFISASKSLTFGTVKAKYENLQFDGKNLRMDKPRMTGADKKNGTYSFAADYALQAIKNPNIITLFNVKGNLDHPDQGPISIKAKMAVYNSKTEHLHMKEKIQIRSKDGMNADLTDAYVELKKKIIISNKPVKVENDDGIIQSDTMWMNSKTGDILFEKKVKVHLKPSQRKDKKADVDLDGQVLSKNIIRK